MGKYWMVIPSPSQPGLAVEFEVFENVYTVTTSNEAVALSQENGDPMAVVLGVPVEGLSQRVTWFRQQYPHSRLYLAGEISPYQLAGLDITSVISIPLSPVFIQGVRADLTIDDDDKRLDSFLLPPVAATVQPVASEEKKREAVGKEQIIVVFSGKGGDGKTSVSAQLGILFAKRGISTLIIDADYKGNEAEWFRGMNQPPIHSILDFREDEKKDRAVLESFLMVSDGLKILPCPQMEVGPIHPDMLERAIQAYKPFYQVIIIDMHQGFSPELLLASQYANKLIAVTVPSDRRLYPFSTTLNQLLSHRVSKKNLHVVINRSHRGEADIRKVRTGLQDMIGESFSQYHVLPLVEELSYDDVHDFVAINDMKSSEPYPTAFLKMAEAITGVSLRKGDSRKTPGEHAQAKVQTDGAKLGFLSKIFGSGTPKKKNTKKSKKKKGGGKR